MFFRKVTHLANSKGRAGTNKNKTKRRRKAEYVCFLSLVNFTQLKLYTFSFFPVRVCFGKVRTEKKMNRPVCSVGEDGLTVLLLTLKGGMGIWCNCTHTYKPVHSKSSSSVFPSLPLSLSLPPSLSLWSMVTLRLVVGSGGRGCFQGLSNSLRTRC